jgi:hypothetical protein
MDIFCVCVRDIVAAWGVKHRLITSDTRDQSAVHAIFMFSTSHSYTNARNSYIFALEACDRLEQPVRYLNRSVQFGFQWLGIWSHSKYPFQTQVITYTDYIKEWGLYVVSFFSLILFRFSCLFFLPSSNSPFLTFIHFLLIFLFSSTSSSQFPSLHSPPLPPSNLPFCLLSLSTFFLVSPVHPSSKSLSFFLFFLVNIFSFLFYSFLITSSPFSLSSSLSVLTFTIVPGSERTKNINIQIG